MTAVCPLCEGTTKVIANHRQATRREPCQFLGVQGLCVPCQLAFPIESAQLTLGS
jgi:hypothetical protein